MPGKWEMVRPTGKTGDGESKVGEPLARSVSPSRVSEGEIDVSFRVEQPRYGLSRVVLPHHTRREIETVIAKVQHHEVLYEDWDLRSIDLSGGRTNINLFGPPGAGKTLCAEAIAFELGKPIIRVNYAEIESKYVGETPKNIKAAFHSAEQEGAVIFFDEADSILGRRLSNVVQSADHGVNASRSVMLLEMDRFSGVTVFASNFAENYDSAFTRRILAHVEIPLPDLECRLALWTMHLPVKMPVEPGLDVNLLGEESEGLTGADILNIVVLAASAAVRRPAPRRVVTTSDLLSAGQSVREAKRVVGSGRRTRTYSEVVDLDNAPPDVLEAARQLPERGGQGGRDGQD